MGRRKTANPDGDKTPWLIKRKLDEVLKSDMQHPGKPLVLHGNDYGGKQRREVVIARPQKAMVTVKDQIIRIQEQADPLGFLIAVQNGDLIPTVFVNEEGEVCTSYQQAGIADRIAVARFLTSKVLPTLSVTKHVIENDSPDPESGAAYDLNRPGQPNFAQLVNMAAEKRRGVHVRDATIVEVETEDAEADQAQQDGGGEADGDGAGSGTERDGAAD